ncbi:MAG: hypothetical protein H0V66_11490 [Bdellovibrionales bacterium]|nr:hypothetical protein [Bdellovibrionales bacterium]
MKSSTYRAGLMYGLLCYAGVTLNYNHFFLFPVGLALLYFYFLRENTDWYRNQFVKYTSLGMFLILITLITHIDLRFFDHALSLGQFKSYLMVVIKRKAFYSLSFIGLAAFILMLIKPKIKLLATLSIDFKRLKELGILVACVIVLGLVVDRDLVKSFGILWFVVFLSILPLEWIFQSISRLRSRRNFIYAIYVLLCLLDSHFEGRVRMLYNFYQSPPDIVEFLNR